MTFYSFFKDEVEQQLPAESQNLLNKLVKTAVQGSSSTGLYFICFSHLLRRLSKTKKEHSYFLWSLLYFTR